jgi:hypothetical protein
MNQEGWRKLAESEINHPPKDPARAQTGSGRVASRIAQSYLPRPPAPHSNPSSLSWSGPTVDLAPTVSGERGPGLFQYLAKGGWWFVERVPPLRWLKQLAERIMEWPPRYSWWLAGIGSFAGLVIGLRTGDTGLLIVAIVAGGIAGRILIPVIALSIIVVAGLSGMAILLAIIGACVAGVVYLLNHVGH